MTLREFLDWPARYLWMAAEGARLDAASASAARRDSGSLASKLAQRNRPGGVIATPVFPED